MRRCKLLVVPDSKRLAIGSIGVVLRRENHVYRVVFDCESHDTHRMMPWALLPDQLELLEELTMEEQLTHWHPDVRYNVTCR